MVEMAESDELIHIVAGKTLKSSDFDYFVPRFENVAAREPGRVPMVIELAPDFSGWDLDGIWRDLKFDVKHKDSFGRIAIVGDSKWEEWGTKILTGEYEDVDRLGSPLPAK
ncbi:STAS/SEC14 domain-containing protein [Allosphingosinicella sp.]|uniref:STAS/SEC14 domain-containing protein n=1 Tax=Allosphingosinicella sp. TaxID=2823234 RepID=UPI002FC158B4